MRLLEQIKLSGFRRLQIAAGADRWTVREASGVVAVEIDEERLRQMIESALASQGRKCKSGPLHVRFVGVLSTRDARPGEPQEPRDDVFHGHTWTSRPR